MSKDNKKQKQRKKTGKMVQSTVSVRYVGELVLRGEMKVEFESMVRPHIASKVRRVILIGMEVICFCNLQAIGI